MTDDELRAEIMACINQQNQLITRLTTLVEKLTNRVEILELEGLARVTAERTPNAPHSGHEASSA